jgi:hypothetical protein
MGGCSRLPAAARMKRTPTLRSGPCGQQEPALGLPPGRHAPRLKFPRPSGDHPRGSAGSLGELSRRQQSRCRKGVYRGTFVAQALPVGSCIRVDTSCDVRRTIARQLRNFTGIGVTFWFCFVTARTLWRSEDGVSGEARPGPHPTQMRALGREPRANSVPQAEGKLGDTTKPVADASGARNDEATFRDRHLQEACLWDRREMRNLRTCKDPVPRDRAKYLPGMKPRTTRPEGRHARDRDVSAASPSATGRAGSQAT